MYRKHLARCKINAPSFILILQVLTQNMSEMFEASLKYKTEQVTFDSWKVLTPTDFEFQCG